jgi:4-hydroxybenzoate polyprenyltransferase
VIIGLVRSMRPKQWTKNLLVFAGYLFTISERHHVPHALESVAAAFALFCLASGACYIYNDVMDVARDKYHPVKRKRPIASGAVPIPIALGVSSIATALTVYFSFRMGMSFGVTVAAYLLLTTAYSVLLKHIVIVDLLVIAAGFVLRAVAGAVVIHVVISPWLLLCTTLLALFLGLAKRRHEIVSLEGDAKSHRKILDEYSVAFLDQMINITSASALMAYALYTFASFSKTASEHPHMMITIPFVMYGMFRYLYLIHTQNAGGHPEQVLLDDKPLLLDIILWAGTVAIILKWDQLAPILGRFY